jgi:hypothetical protein
VRDFVHAMIEDELEGTLQWPRYATTELEKSQNDVRKGRRSRVREPCDATTKRLRVRPRRTFNRPTETPTSGFRVPQLSASFTLILVVSAYQPRQEYGHIWYGRYQIIAA